MQKLDMQTPDLTLENIEAIARLFPNTITEKEGENGEIVKAVDFDLLKQVLSRDLVEDSDERYRLDWPGKKASILKANTPINKTLRPVREDSINFDTTENLYIEGDNFEVLKVLQESYLWKVKMIYIDPPYNTGKDFVYTDDYAKKREEELESIWAIDEEWNKYFKPTLNTDTNGRFHSDWLSMMHERLLVARDLLQDDGVIFMSIDDNEVHNLRKIADEVFGEENFVVNMYWQSKSGGWHDEKAIVKENEYIIVYSKNKFITSFGRRTIDNPVYKLTDKFENVRGKYALNKLDRMMRGEHYSEALNYSITAPDGTAIWPWNENKKTTDWNWRWSKTKFAWGIENDFLEIKKSSTGNWAVYSKQYEYVDNNWELVNRDYPYRSLILSSEFNTTKGWNEIKESLDSNIFDYAKPLGLISHLIRIAWIKSDELILDFFSGSATTAHAVMQLNAEDEWSRKFIIVQIPEETDPSSEAYKAGYKTICEIGKERIRRAGKKILEENKDKPGIDKLDVGFRVFRLDSSNMKDVYYHPMEVSQAGLFEMESNIKEDRSNEDLLAQVMLDLGLTLDLPIESRKIAGNTVFFVANNSLVACFDEGVDFSLVDEIAKCEPLKVVFRDSSFRTDADRINFETRFKKLSPETDVRVI